MNCRSGYGQCSRTLPSDLFLKEIPRISFKEIIKFTSSLFSPFPIISVFASITGVNGRMSTFVQVSDKFIVRSNCFYYQRRVKIDSKCTSMD